MSTTIKKYKKSIFSDIDSSEKIIKLLGKDSKFIKYILDNKDEFYSTKQLTIKNKPRTITPSKHGLKQIHTTLETFFSKRIIFPKYIHGSVKGKSPKTNAQIHIGKDEVFKFDVKDFYPSIKTTFIEKTLKDSGMADDAAKLVADLCTYNNSLPQGIEVAPILANLVLLPTSIKIHRFCKKRRLDFSVYMDDLTISGNKKIDPYWGSIKQMVTQALFEVSKKKTRFMNKNQAQISTKLNLNSKMRPENTYLKKLKTDIKNYMGSEEDKHLLMQIYEKTDRQMYFNLRGRINYVRQYDKKMARELRALLVKN